MSGNRQYDGRHAGAGDLGIIDSSKLVELGPCPSCGALLEHGNVIDPDTGLLGEALTHRMPFCHYYGATDPDQIKRDVAAGTKVQ